MSSKELVRDQWAKQLRDSGFTGVDALMIADMAVRAVDDAFDAVARAIRSCPESRQQIACNLMSLSALSMMARDKCEDAIVLIGQTHGVDFSALMKGESN